MIETQLQPEAFALVQGVFGSLEIHVPELEVVGGKDRFDFWVFLDGFELLLQPLRHSCRHLTL